MSRPLKKPTGKPKKPFPTKKVGQTLQKIGSALKPIAQSHPVIAGLAIMTGCTLAKVALDGLGSEANSKNYSVQRAHSWLGALYADTHILTATFVTVPLIGAGLQTVGGILSSKAGGT